MGESGTVNVRVACPYCGESSIAGEYDSVEDLHVSASKISIEAEDV